ncbi:hypothetical protein IAG41_09750 [Sphingomonas sp. JC676]|uniref:hypothetical protein n=1 Tax=Sphingomonas sp. JC676 TaxID=2768065 RepID=UPI001657672F|nr:hypothetical protein [Sphingomonas sp. JC676]MBC9032675.1 hypothetical protein [Sphingomonas sp. JC676]
MSYKLLLLATALSASASANAGIIEQAASEPMVEISASGDGTWYVRCQVQRDINSGLRELNKDRPAYRDDHMRRATCHYESNKKGLTIKIVGAGWACPFKGAAEGDCTFTDNKLGSGQFRIERSAH